MRGRRHTNTLLFGALPGALVIATTALGASVAEARPPLLPERAGCELWLGEAHGNDPGVRINLRLCPREGGALTGELQWSGQESGWNVRAVEGTRTGDQIGLRDVRIVEERPEPGWRFCTIERYELRAVGSDRLSGRYVSTSCNDQATLELRRVEGPTGGDPTRTSETRNEAETPLAIEAPTVEPPVPGATEQSSGCGCQVGTPASPSAMSFFLGGFVLWRRFRWTRKY